MKQMNVTNTIIKRNVLGH